MKLYKYDPKTHVFETELEYNSAALFGASIPNTTSIAPPPAQAGKVSKWSPSVGTWVQVDKPVEVPTEVSMWKAKFILEVQGYLAQADALISQMSGADGVVAKHKWTHATVVNRKDPLVAGIQVAMGWTDEVVDGMFIAAANLK